MTLNENRPFTSCMTSEYNWCDGPQNRDIHEQNKVLTLGNIAAFLYILDTCRVNTSTVFALNQNQDLKSQNAFIFVLKLDTTLIGQI